MKYLVISDVHSNLIALQAVLADAEKHGPYDGQLNVGDLVGYGPNPNECVDIVRDRGFTSVLGNHDRVVRREHSTGSSAHFNFNAREAAHFNRRELTSESRAYLAGLSNAPYIEPEGRFAMVHGSFAGNDDSYENIYVVEEHDAVSAMYSLCFDDDSNTDWKHSKLGIVGHTHVPMYARCWAGYSDHYIENSEFTSPLPPSLLEVNFGEEPNLGSRSIFWQPKALFNPGSVGQPRDGNPRAAYGIMTFDGDKITLESRRVEYDIAETQKRMRERNLPQRLIDRLATGR